jgi:hypothetical protein
VCPSNGSTKLYVTSGPVDWSVGKKQDSLIGWLDLGSAAVDRSMRRVIPALNLNTITKISLKFAILRNCVHQRNHQTRFTRFGPIDVLIAFVGRMDGTTIRPWFAPGAALSGRRPANGQNVWIPATHLRTALCASASRRRCAAAWMTLCQSQASIRILP